MALANTGENAMWSKRLKYDITDPKDLDDYDLNLFVAELEGYKFDEDGNAYEQASDGNGGYTPVPVYFSGNYDKMFRLLVHHQIDLCWVGVPELIRCRASACGDKETMSRVVSTKHSDYTRAILETYVRVRLKEEEIANDRQLN